MKTPHTIKGKTWHSAHWPDLQMPHSGFATPARARIRCRLTLLGGTDTPESAQCPLYLVSLKDKNPLLSILNQRRIWKNHPRSFQIHIDLQCHPAFLLSLSQLCVSVPVFVSGAPTRNCQYEHRPTGRSPSDLNKSQFANANELQRRLAKAHLDKVA